MRDIKDFYKIPSVTQDIKTLEERQNRIDSGETTLAEENEIVYKKVREEYKQWNS